MRLRLGPQRDGPGGTRQLRKSATVRQAPLLPCRRCTVTTSWSLVASRPQMLTVLGWRYATKGKRKAERVGLAFAFSSDDEWKYKPLCHWLGLGKSWSKNQVTSDTPDSHI